MTEPQSILDLPALLADAGERHLLGSLTSADLNVNLLTFSGEEGIDEHVNREVDVLLVALAGEGVVTVDGEATVLAAGQVTIIPKGTARSIRANGERFAYLTCHGQRRGMMPTVKTRQGA
jgi:quercetin dioxygenase-like cupin family protein